MTARIQFLLIPALVRTSLFPSTTFLWLIGSRPSKVYLTLNWISSHAVWWAQPSSVQYGAVNFFFQVSAFVLPLQAKVLIVKEADPTLTALGEGTDIYISWLDQVSLCTTTSCLASCPKVSSMFLLLGLVLRGWCVLMHSLRRVTSRSRSSIRGASSLIRLQIRSCWDI